MTRPLIFGAAMIMALAAAGGCKVKPINEATSKGPSDEAGSSGSNAERERFFTMLRERIGKIAGDHPQLAAWDREKADMHWTSSGVKTTHNLLSYSNNLKKTTSSNYKDAYEENGCHISVKVYTEKEFMMVAGVGVKTLIFGRKMGAYRLIASVITENPEKPDLETKIYDIIKACADDFSSGGAE